MNFTHCLVWETIGEASLDKSHRKDSVAAELQACLDISTFEENVNNNFLAAGRSSRQF